MAGIFKKNDIRGLVDTELTENFAENLGYIFGKHVGKCNIAIAGDTRASTPRIMKFLCQGIRKSGCNIYNLGMGPTPLTYFAAAHFDNIDQAIMVTGSHNPPDQNGIKICDNKGQSYHYDNLFRNLEEQLSIFNEDLSTIQLSGNVIDAEYMKDEYFNYLAEEIKLENSFSVMVDYGKGATVQFGEVLRKMGLKVEELGTEPDGTFDGHPPDPAKPHTFDNLKNKIDDSFTIAIAFDTDGDRVGFMTNNHEIISPDQVTMLLAESVVKHKEKPSVIIDVKVSKATAEYISTLQGTTKLSQVGHSYIHELLIEENADLAAELSGHYYFNDKYYGFDDGLYAAIRFLEAIDLLISDGSSIEDKLLTLPKFDATPEYRIEKPYEIIDKILEDLSQIIKDQNGSIIDIDGVRGELSDGWFLARKSGTEELISYRVEGDSPEAKNRILDLLQSVIAKY